MRFPADLIRWSFRNLITFFIHFVFLWICLYAASAQGVSPDFEALKNEPAWQSFIRRFSGSWAGYVDPSTGYIREGFGSGIAFIPGRGNSLPDSREKIDLNFLGRRGYQFLTETTDLFGLTGFELHLDSGRSGSYGEPPYMWYLTFNLESDHIAIQKAGVRLIVNNGNLVAFSASVPPSLPPRKVLHNPFTSVRGRAESELWRNLNVRNIRWLEVIQKWRWEGDRYLLVWEGDFQDGLSGERYWVTVSGEDGSVIESLTLATDGVVLGGARHRLLSKAETLVPFGNMFVTDGASIQTTASDGNYSFVKSPVTALLSGPYATLQDYCGNTRVIGDSEIIDLGFSVGTDCSTAPPSAPGNTAAARTAFYHVNRIRDLYRGYDSKTVWLDSPVGVITNFPFECQNFWDGNNIVLNSQGGSNVCANAGENPGVVYHEWGHAYQQNAHGPVHELATREGYADVTSFLQTRDSCIAKGFFLNGNRSPEDGSVCDGFREVDFTRLDPPLPATPQNITEPPYNCQPGIGGILGLKPHCESHIMSEAMWELAQAFIQKYGVVSGWERLQRLWVGATPLMDSAWTVVDKGPPVVSHGCGLVNWYHNLRIVDDDNGNLTDGTPNGALLYQAFNNHNIACAPFAPWNVDYSTCPDLDIPVLSGNYIPKQSSMMLHWTLVAGARGYQVLRSEIGPEGPYTVIKTSDATTTDFTDLNVTHLMVHWYVVLALGEGNCRSNLSKVIQSTLCVPSIALVEPNNGFFTANTTPVLSWSEAMVGTHYSLYLSPNPDPSYFDTYTSTSVTIPVGILIPGVRYYWKVVAFKVVAYNDNFFCRPAVSEVWSFTVPFLCAGPVVLKDPISGSTVATTTPTLRWKASQNATLYSLYLSPNPDPSYFNTYTSTSVTIPTDILFPGVRYYWKVVAYNRAISCPPAVSEVWSFTVPFLCAGPVVLKDPISGSTVATTTPTLRWEASQNATLYSLYLSPNPDPSYFNTYTSTSVTIPVDILFPGVRYYWKVVAYNDDIFCPPAVSEVWSFTVPFLCAGPVVLKDPISGSTVATTTPTLRWEASQNATLYSLYLSPNPDPSYFNTYTSTSVTIPTDILFPGVRYYWKVVAYNRTISCPPTVSATYYFDVHL